ncbi:hypothetical protein EPIR_1049 [Erwinia piriflorinigrans CFBP 5888]|uniref:Uncharacterized protein n=1 Tax=Erwinia piriflorinigrans CFBP 5888 TaxID=1161919 RepID=V5Z615_9GAMM|nr:hypothetical protein EPIR_1049 [Erwinia piriflorinigrans CFBP 5888]
MHSERRVNAVPRCPDVKVKPPMTGLAIYPPQGVPLLAGNDMMAAVLSAILFT